MTMGTIVVFAFGVVACDTIRPPQKGLLRRERPEQRWMPLSRRDGAVVCQCITGSSAAANPEAHPSNLEGRMSKRILGKLARRGRRTVAAYRAATPLQKMIVGAWALGIGPMMVGGVMGDDAPLWVMVLMVAVMLGLAIGIGHAYWKARRTG